jgi:lipoprotein-anchoring transpeptidase ErfK/SrfK
MVAICIHICRARPFRSGENGRRAGESLADFMKYTYRYGYRRRRHPLRVAAVCAAVCLVAAAGVFAAARVPAVHALLFASPAARQTALKAAASPSSGKASSALSAKEASSSGAASSSASAVSAVQASQVSLRQAAKPLWIKVGIADQVMTVYDADDRVVASWLCSTGSPGYDTPSGTFTVYNRGKRFFSKKYEEGAYYWVAFYEDYYFHSVPFDQNGQIIQSVANDLGHKDSHGCVHLTVDESQWVYDNIPNGTKVVIG